MPLNAPTRPLSNVFVHKRISQGNFIIQPPIRAGQVPVARFNAQTNSYDYVAEDNPFTALAIPANIGKALIVNQQGDGLTVSDFLVSNELVEALLNNSGYIGDLTITKVSDTEIRISPFIGVIANSATNVRHIVKKVAESFVSIPGANSNVANNNVTYVLLTLNGKFVTVESSPSSTMLDSELFLCEVFHPNGGPIQSIRLVASAIDNLLSKFYIFGDRIGLIPNNFAFSYNAPTGVLSQTSTNAYLWGYNISASSSDPHTISFAMSAITVDYYSYDNAQSAPVLSSWIRSYKVDDVTAGTSSPITGQRRGIVVLYATRGGKYFALAPQQRFTNFAEASSQRIMYLSQVRLPAVFREEMTPVAMIIVAGSVANNAGANDFSVSLVGSLSISSGSVVSTGIVPLPSSGAPGSFLKVNTAGDAYILAPDSAPDASAITAWKALAGENGNLVYKDIVPGDVFASAMSQGICEKIGKFTISGGVIANKTSELNDLGTLSIVGNSVVITADNIFGYLMVMDASDNKVTVPIFNLTFSVPGSIQIGTVNCTCFVFFTNLSLIS